MLALTRKRHEGIVIGDALLIAVQELHPNESVVLRLIPLEPDAEHTCFELVPGEEVVIDRDRVGWHRADAEASSIEPLMVLRVADMQCERVRLAFEADRSLAIVRAELAAEKGFDTTPILERLFKDPAERPLRRRDEDILQRIKAHRQRAGETPDQAGNSGEGGTAG